MSIVNDFIVEMEKCKPVFAKEVRKSYEMEPGLFEELARPMLTWAEEALGPHCFKRLIDGYCYFVVDVNKSQYRYELSGKYENSSYAEVSKTTYNSPEFMNLYHWGVYTTTFAWLHHLELYRFYRDSFLDKFIRKIEPGTVLDLGSGSGIWHFIFLNRIRNWKCQAVDISETSVNASRNMAKVAVVNESVRYEVHDALNYRGSNLYDAAVSCFLLEHLEDPNLLFASLNANIKPGGYAFITAALTAAEVDHIYEYRFESEPILMAENAGFRVIQIYSSAPVNIPESKKYLPRSMALILQKKLGLFW